MNVQKANGKVHTTNNDGTAKCGAGVQVADAWDGTEVRTTRGSEFLETSAPVDCKRCLKALGKTITPAAKPEAPKPARCSNSGLVDGNPRRLYGNCRDCGKEGKNQGGKLRAHAPAK